MDTFTKCLLTLQTCKNDSEKIASLLIISKIAPSLDLNKDIGEQLMKAITGRFLLRLIKNKSTVTTKKDGSETANENILQDIGFNIIQLLLKINPDVIKGEDELIKEICSLLFKNSDIDNKIQLNCIGILVSISSTKSGSEMILQHLELKELKLFLFESELSMKVYSLLTNLIYHGQTSADRLREQLLALVYDLSENFKTRQDIEKFHHVGVLTKLFTILPSDGVFFDLELQSNDNNSNSKHTPSHSRIHQILLNLRQGFFDILQSKIKSNVKQSILILISHTIQNFHSKWLFDENNYENISKFLLLTLTIVSIEMNILLQNQEKLDGDDSKYFHNLITASCIITKVVMQFLCSDHFETTKFYDDSDFILKIMHCLKNVVTPMFFYLGSIEVASIKLDDPVLLSIVPLICYWLTEETNSFQDEIQKILPLFIKLIKLDVQEKPSENDVVLLHHIIPCISQILPDNKIRKMLIQLNFHEPLIRYMILICNTAEVNDKNMENLVHLLHEFIILEAELSSSDIIFDELQATLKKILNSYLLDDLISLYAKLEMMALFFTLLRLRDFMLDSVIYELFTRSYEFLFGSVRQCIVNDEMKTIWIIAGQNINDLAINHKQLHDELKKSTVFTKFMKIADKKYGDFQSVF